MEILFFFLFFFFIKKDPLLFISLYFHHPNIYIEKASMIQVIKSIKNKSMLSQLEHKMVLNLNFLNEKRVGISLLNFIIKVRMIKTFNGTLFFFFFFFFQIQF
ncbi:hypothetical protein HMI54_010448 [Coelomomyces lativittatus]|nr:hypothetical protein HMI54_010448 [Coelomomyces lativittatus]